MSDSIQINTTGQTPPCLQHQIEKTRYLIEVHFSDTSAQSKVLEFLILKDQNHPLLSVRAYDILRWCESPNFQMVMKSINSDASVETNCCPVCGAQIKPGWAFCKQCGNKLQ